MGLLGLDPDSLYNFTFREFSNAVRGRYKYQEHFQRSDWERTRWQTALLLNVHTKKGKTITAKDLGAFPWEEKQKPNLQRGWTELKALAIKKDG